MIREALKDAQLAPSQVDYLEAHGTGTEFGDPMELGAAASIYGQGRPAENPLLVGSVKANISHLEAAGGISGLIKTVLSLHHGVIPQQMHFDQPSPHIPWNQMPVKVVTQTTRWPAGEERVAGVTALGLVGTNAHVILSNENSESTHSDTNGSSDRAQAQSQLLTISARDESTLAELVNKYRLYLEAHPDADLADVSFTLAAGRRHFDYRIAFTAGSTDDAIKALSHAPNRLTKHDGNGSSQRNGHSSLAKGVVNSTPMIGWFFGRRCEAFALAKSLYHNETKFRSIIDELDARLTSHSEQNEQGDSCLSDWLTADTATADVDDVRSFAMQIGLAQLWRSWGIEPDVAMGWGVGQYAAACVVGGLDASDAIILVHERQEILSQLPAPVEGQTTPELTDEHVERLDRFESLADNYNYYPPNTPLICGLSGQMVPVHRSLGGSYWRRHCLELPLEGESLAAFDESCDYVLGFGLSDSPVNKSRTETSARWLKIDESSAGRVASLLTTLGQLYVAGVTPQFENLYESTQRKRISLPTYPFQKKRYWITEISDHIKMEARASRVTT